jgi:WD40 repeat protein
MEAETRWAHPKLTTGMVSSNDSVATDMCVLTNLLELQVKRVAFSPYSRMLATTSGDATARLFDTSTFECLHVLSSHTDHVFDVAWSPTVDFLVTASHDRFWKLWRPARTGDKSL